MKDKNVESEAAAEGVSVVPILSEGIGSRISDVSRLHGSRKAAASAAGVTVDTLHRWIREAVGPSFEAMAGLAAPVGVSLDWLAFEKGPMRLDEKSQFDVEALQAAVETLEKALQMLGRTVTDPADRARLTAQVYGYLTDDAMEPSERVLGVLKLVK